MADEKCTALPDWEDLRHALALARHGTLSATARALAVNHATVARRVASLAAAVGRPLFERRPDGYVLTEDGRRLIEGAAAMETAARAAVARVESGGGVCGSVRLATTRALADGFLAPRLGRLAEAHPGIALEIVTGSRMVSLARREADLALRLGAPRDSALRGRRLAWIGHHFYAVARWRGVAAAPLVGFDGDSGGVPEAAWLERFAAGRRFALRADGWTTQAAAAASGLGVALLPDYLAAAFPDLVMVDLGDVPPRAELWLLLPPDLAQVPRVRAVADALSALCGALDDQAKPPLARTT